MDPKAADILRTQHILLMLMVLMLMELAYMRPIHKFFPQTLSDSDSVDRQRARAKNSEGGEVPEKYFIVTNNQLLRVKYLLVYSQRKNLSR